MKHRRTTAKLGRPADHRRAMMRNLATSLSLHGRVTTTTPRAKALVGYYERLISLAKRNNEMNAIRLLKRHLFTEASQKAFLKRLSSFSTKSGHLRAMKIGLRKGDRSELTLVECISSSS